jgi:hypothetical protein
MELWTIMMSAHSMRQSRLLVFVDAARQIKIKMATELQIALTGVQAMLARPVQASAAVVCLMLIPMQMGCLTVTICALASAITSTLVTTSATIQISVGAHKRAAIMIMMVESMLWMPALGTSTRQPRVFVDAIKQKLTVIRMAHQIVQINVH